MGARQWAPAQSSYGSAGPRLHPAPVSALAATTPCSPSFRARFGTSVWARTGGASASSRSSSFVDSARVVLRAGHGGRGSSSFRPEPFVPPRGAGGGGGGPRGSGARGGAHPPPHPALFHDASPLQPAA